jgi:predicted Ser/Thr protein kinase
MPQEWYIDTSGRVEGPVSVGELRNRAADGRLGPADRVSVDRVDWVPAETLPGLPFPAKPRRPLLETVVAGSVHPDDSDLDTDEPAPQIDGYDVQGVLGRGACGVVYKARHVSLDRVVALKTVRMAKSATREVATRFEQEARSLAGLQHPNVVTVYDYGTCKEPTDQKYFAMELLDGVELGEKIDREGALDERTAWLIARQTAAALSHAAKAGVIHRDIKPANLFLVPAPTGFPLPPGIPLVKVTDFGLALTRGGPGDIDQRQTAAGVLLGTPVYMAPEQFAGSDVDVRADIYSLGATVFHMVTGQPPFDGRTVWEVMKRKSGPVPRLGPPVSAESADLVGAMMAVEAGDRPADYSDLIARIDALPCLDTGTGNVMFSSSGRMPAPPPLTPEPVVAAVAAAPPAPPVRRKRWVFVLAGLGLLGVGAGVAIVAGALNRPRVQKVQTNAPDEPEPGAKAANYTTGAQQLLYTSGLLDGWKPGGGSWKIEQDDAEKTPVIAGFGIAARPFDPPPTPNFRVTLSFDPTKASAVEVVIATTDGPPASATRWLVRLDRATGGVFGKRVGTGAFEPRGAGVEIPTAQDLAEKGGRPYLEVKYERAGGTLSTWFRGQPLGSIPAAGLKMSELRVQSTGGIRIDSAVIEELIEQK